MMFASSPSCTTDDAIGTGQSGSNGSGRNPPTVHQSPSSSRSILSSSSAPLVSVVPPPVAGASSSASQSAVGDMWSGAFKALQNPTNAFMLPNTSSSTSTAHAPPSSMSLGLPFFQAAQQLAGGSPHPQIMALWYQQLMQAPLPSSNQQYAHAMQQFLQLQQVALNHQSTGPNTPDDQGSCLVRENQLREEHRGKVNDVEERQHAISKLKMGPDGKTRCPICEESMGLSARDWRSHVELELSNLKKLKESISTAKVHQGRDKTRSGNPGPGLGDSVAQRMSRELGLITHRNLRMKRLAARQRVPASLSVFSPISPSSGGGTSSQLKCSACGVYAEFLVISNQLERGRCWECFGWRRQHPPSPVSNSIPNDAEKQNGVNPNDPPPPPPMASPHNGSGQLHGGERTPECHNGNGGTNGAGEEETKDLKSWDPGFLNGLCCSAGEHRPSSKRPNGSDGAYDESCPTMVVKRSRIDSQ